MYREGFIIVPSEYHSLYVGEIDRLEGAVIQRYSSDFTPRLSMACHGNHYLVSIVFKSTTNEFFDV